MGQNCEICENNEIKYLPYPIENEIYINYKIWARI